MMSEEEDVQSGGQEFQSVLGGFTEEQLQAARDKARQLSSRDVTVNHLVSTLIAARRLYGLARMRLHQVLEAQEGCRWMDGVEETILQSVEAFDETPYQLGELIHAMNGAALPFLTDELQREQERQRTETLRLEQAAEAERLSRKIPLVIYQDKEPVEFERGSLLVFCGHRKHMQTINGLLLKVVENNESDEQPPIYMVRLLAKPKNDLLNKQEQHERVSLDVGINKWLNTFGSTNKTIKQLDGYARLLARPRIDLLVVEDLHSLFTGGPTWRKKGQNAVDSLKSLGRWAKDNKAVVLGYADFEESEIEDRTAFVSDVQKHVEIFMV